MDGPVPGRWSGQVSGQRAWMLSLWSRGCRVLLRVRACPLGLFALGAMLGQVVRGRTGPTSDHQPIAASQA